MGQAKIVGGGATNVVNGIIEKYYAATDDVKANTFVEYLKKFELSQPSAAKHLTSGTVTYGLSATKLSENKVFVAYVSLVSSSYNVYGVVCTISDGTITPGTVVTISSNGSLKIQNVTVVTLTSTKVAVVYSTVLGSSAKAYAQICTISGTTISVGTSKEITVGTGNFGTIKAAPLTSSTFIVIGQSANLYAVACSVSGTTVTVGSSVIIRSSSDTTQAYYDIAKLTSNKVIVSYGGAPSNSILYACARVLSISGTTITMGTQSAQASISGYTIYSKIIAVSETKAVMLAGSYLNSAVVCTITGTSVTFGTSVNVGSMYYSAALVALNARTVGLIQPVGSSLVIQIYLLQIAESVITLVKNSINFMQIKGSSFEYDTFTAITYEGTHFMLAGPYAISTANPAGQTSQLLDYEGIMPLTTAENFLGLTVTKATKTSQGKVWILKGE